MIGRRRLCKFWEIPIRIIKCTCIDDNTANVPLSDAEIAEKVSDIFDLRPYAIEKRLKLRNPIYLETAAYGHMGRQPIKIKKIFQSPYSGRVETEVDFFTWEKLEYLNQNSKALKL